MAKPLIENETTGSDRSQIMEDPEYYNLRNYALDFLYRRFAHDDE